MYHQFKELADVDITAEPMEVGPTCHYVMGGVEVDPDTAAAVVPGLFAAGEVAGGMHGSNRLGGNSLSDLLVFGRRAGLGAAEYVDALGAAPADGHRRATSRTRRSEAAGAVRPATGGENPYTIHAGPAADDERPGRHHPHRGRSSSRRSTELEALKARAASSSPSRATGQFNPGWHLALDLPQHAHRLGVHRPAALEREESRGGHTRDDFPGDERRVAQGQPRLPAGRRRRRRSTAAAAAGHAAELLALFDRDELTST